MGVSNRLRTEKLVDLQSRKFVCYDVDAPEIRKIPSSCFGTILAKNKEAAVNILKNCVTHYKPTTCGNCNRCNATRNPEIPTIERLAETGQSEIIKTISKEDRDKINYPNILRSMVKAAAGGHIETMKVLKGWDVVFSYNMALARAAENGQIEAMNKLREWSAVDYELAFASAAEGGHVEAMKILKWWGTSSSYNEALARAAAAGQLEAMKVLRTWGATDYRAAFYDAAASGCTQALKLLNEWDNSIHDYDTALAVAAINGREDAIQFLVQLSANDYDRALVHAAVACRVKALKLIIELKNRKEMNLRASSYSNIARLYKRIRARGRRHSPRRWNLP